MREKTGMVGWAVIPHPAIPVQIENLQRGQSQNGGSFESESSHASLHR